MEAAYPWIKIWESWTDVQVRYGFPDDLAWGSDDLGEILFWLTADSGYSSKRTMYRHYRRRLSLAMKHAYDWATRVVFCIMEPPWVVKAFAECLDGMRLSNNTVVIGHDWREFGKLPNYKFGRWNEDLDVTQAGLKQRKQSSDGLPFDPAKYPRKAKKWKVPKSAKKESTKSRYTSPSFDDGFYWELDVVNDR